MGTISTQTGTLAANFSSLIYGERAYFDYINAQGGVNGRKINYQYALDDGGNPTTFNQLANTLINQDHVFAVTGVGTAFFSPNLFVESGIPTYGYNVTGNWQGPSNLFAAGGSVQYYAAGAPEVAYLARKTQKSPSIAFVAYGVAASAAACQSEQNALTAAGYKVSYSDLKINYPGLNGGDRRAAHEAGRLEHGRQLHGRAGQRHDGQGDQAVRVEHDPGVVQRERPVDAQHQRESDAGRLFQHLSRSVLGVPVPLSGSEALLGRDEEVRARLRQDEIALQGWESAALFVQGVKMAGSNLTQANVIKEDNTLTAFTAGGLQTPVNWVSAGHTGHAPPYCLAYIKVSGDTYVPALNKGNNVFNCFNSINPKSNPVFPLPAGTPAPG